MRALLAQNRLVTLCGTGGVGKTRLAIQIASASELRDGLCFVDLAPITESGIVAATAARAVGLPISRAVQPWIVFADSSAIAACSWCWTTVNIFSMRAQRWSLSYWGLSGADDLSD